MCWWLYRGGPPQKQMDPIPTHRHTPNHVPGTWGSPRGRPTRARRPPPGRSRGAPAAGAGPRRRGPRTTPPVHFFYFFFCCGCFCVFSLVRMDVGVGRTCMHTCTHTVDWSDGRAIALYGPPYTPTPSQKPQTQQPRTAACRKQAGSDCRKSSPMSTSPPSSCWYFKIHVAESACPLAAASGTCFRFFGGWVGVGDW